MFTIYLSILIFNLVAIFMKKKLNPLLYYACIYFAVLWAEVSDRFADKYDLYYFFNPKIIEFQKFWILLGIYPAATMIIINWFPYRKSWKHKAVYILSWSLFSIFYEWLSLSSGFLHYNRWKLWQSTIVYPIIFSALILNVYFLKWMNRKFNHLKQY
jgi:hypothetical protein